MAKPKPLTSCLALALGLNVGRRNRLPMKALIALFEVEGGPEVRPHGLSGKVLYHAELDPDRSPPAAFAARGREISLACANGSGRTKLTAAGFESQLATTATARNHRTVLKLLELAS